MGNRAFSAAVAVCFISIVTVLPIKSQIVDPGIHPGFDLTSLRPAGFNPMVSGLAFLPNGDLVVSTWENFGANQGHVYILKNAQTGNAAQVTYTTFGSNMNEPLGVTVSGGEIYVIDKDSLLQMVDADKNQVLDSKRRIAGGWFRNPTDNTNKDLQFALGMIQAPAPDNRFIVGLATRWVGGLASSTAERGCILGMALNRTNYDIIACGIRTPNGVTLGPENGIFVTDNQGNYVPGSKLLHIKQGRFFGVLKSVASPFETAAVTPPVVWMPHGTDIHNVAVSPTQPVFLQSGVFANQMVVGDNCLGTLKRISLEKVNGEYQGAVFRFTGGLQAGANRIITGPDGALYVGGIGTPAATWGGWAWNNQYYGLQRMTENGSPFFDIVGVRSTGNNSFAIDFTEPVTAAVASNFTVQQWSYSPAFTYGCCRNATQTLTVTAASLSANRMTANLTITGLTQFNVVYIQLAGITASSGRPLWSNRFWYTLNNFGPGIPVKVVEEKLARQNPDLWKAKTSLLPGGRISLTWRHGLEKAEILDLAGRVLESISHLEIQNGQWESSRNFARGSYFVRIHGGTKTLAMKIAVP